MDNTETSHRPKAVIFGCTGLTLYADEAQFFATENPLGFILFQRNCESPEQVSALVKALRATVGRADAPVLIDQEGGRVARLKPPHWRHPPAAKAFADLYRTDPQKAVQAARLSAEVMARDLIAIGIDVDCAPVLDLPAPDGHEIIGDRAYGAEPDQIIALGRAVIEGLEAGGVMPIIKHIPGHGRATADSHLELPQVAASLQQLRQIDFAPFKGLNTAGWAMTAHVLYSAIDPSHPATTSRKVIADIIRGEIGFDGVLVSDDLGMKALGGAFKDRAVAALAAGCDLVLHCSGDLNEMREVAAGTGMIADIGMARLSRARGRLKQDKNYDRADALAQLAAVLGRTTA